jgi:hypothetical protein
MTKSPKLLSFGVLCMVGATAAGHAQGTLATATISGVAAGSMYDYTITLNDVSASTSLETFWFAWNEDGYDFLPSSPTSVTSPSAWSGEIDNAGPGDGYSILYTTSTAPLTPGSSLTFSFVSPDSPAALAGDSPDYPGYPTTTSYVYSGGPFSGASQEFTLTSVPEPGSMTLLASGLGVLWRARRKVRAVSCS